MTQSDIQQFRNFLAQARELAQSSLADPEFHAAVRNASMRKLPNASTAATYASRWAHFKAFCRERHLAELPVAEKTLVEYIFACSSGTLSPMQRNGFPTPEAVATIEGRVSAIKYFHGHHSVPYLSGNVASAENIRSVLSALKAVMNEEESAGESQMPWREFRQAVGALSAESSLERAILLVSHFGRLSPQQVVSLNFEDVSFGKANEPIQLSIGGPDIREPKLVDLPILSDVQMSPTSALRSWTLHRGRSDGPLFPADIRTMERSKPSRVDLILADALDRAGLDPSQYTDHTLQCGRLVRKADVL